MLKKPGSLEPGFFFFLTFLFFVERDYIKSFLACRYINFVYLQHIIFHTRMNYYENKPDRESKAHEHRV